MSGTCLSIDWDFFVPDAVPLWDDSWIDESFHHLWEVWRDPSRLEWVDDIDVVGAKGFWRVLSKWFVLPSNRHATISESHEAMHDLLTKEHKTLLLFDSHHDCYYLSEKNERGGSPDCGQWGTYWLKRNRGRRVMWISQLKKEDRKSAMSMVDSCVRRKVKAYSLGEAKHAFDSMCKRAGGKIELDFVHICRSGCWSPPWVDKDFLLFLKRSQLKCDVIKHVHGSMWDPTLDRWKNDSMKYVYESMTWTEAEAYASFEC